MWVLTVAYLIAPCSIGVFAIVVFVRRRPMAPGAIWLIGSAAVALLVSLLSWLTQYELRGQIPISILLKALGTLYYILFVVSTGAAMGMRSLLRSRALGVVLLIGLLLATGMVASR